MATVTSTANPAVKAARKLARARARSAGAFLVEGPQAVREAVGHLERVFVTSAAAVEHADLVEAAGAGGAEIVEASDHVLEALATTVTPQGIAGVAVLAEPSLPDALQAATLVVVLHEPRDPGNAGAVVRTCDAAGVDAVVLVGEAVDPRNPKAVRASAGSLFHLPVCRVADWEAVRAGCRQAGLALVATAAGAASSHVDRDLSAPTALVFGNEAHGLPREVTAAVDATIGVPLVGAAESLNLAATVAVVVYEAARQRHRWGRSA